MRTSGFIITLVILAYAVPLRAQKLVVDSLVAVRPFGDPVRYSWPVIRMPGKYAIARRINEELFQWGERFIDPDTAGAHFFDEVWGTPEGAMMMMGPPHWDWQRPFPHLLVIRIEAEFCGAYCEGSSEHYHYDLRDGNRVKFDSLFTSSGLQQVKSRIGQRWRTLLESHLTMLTDSISRGPDREWGGWLSDAVELYERCLKERGSESVYVNDMSITPGGVNVWVARCSHHIDMAGDDLMEVEIPLTRAELVPLMRPAELKWLGW